MAGDDSRIANKKRYLDCYVDFVFLGISGYRNNTYKIDLDIRLARLGKDYAFEIGEKPMKEMPLRFFNDDGTPNQETIETIKELAQQICSGDWICTDCSPQCGVFNYAIKQLKGSEECVWCINPYQTNPYNYCPYCGRKLKGATNEK